MERIFFIIASAVMFLSVGAGAFGAHSLNSYFIQHPNLKITFDTSVQYMTIHGLGLFAVSLVYFKWNEALVRWAGILFIVGIILFSGSLVLLVLTRMTWLGAVTPFGGIAFLAGWLLLGLAAWKM